MVKTCSSKEQAVCWDSLVNRMPKAIKCSDQSEMLRRDLVHSHFLGLLLKFKEDESLVTLVHNYLSTDILKKATTSRLASSSWSDQYTKLYRLPKSWKASQLIRISQGKIDTQLIKKLDSKDLDSIPTIWYMMHQVSANDDLHPVLLNKATNDEFWDARAHQVGDLWKGWVEEAVDKDGVIDWRKGACYTVIFSGDRATKIRHIGGDEYAVPSTTHITPDFSMLFPHDHMKCQLQCGILKVDLADCFGVGTGPHRFRVSKTTDFSCSFQQLLNAYITKAGNQATLGLNNQQVHQQVSAALSEGAKGRAQEMQKKAVMAAKAKAAKRTRTLKLHDSK
jgi:hypothetical protein